VCEQPSGSGRLAVRRRRRSQRRARRSTPASATGSASPRPAAPRSAPSPDDILSTYARTSAL
jgi:hypothetical protein